MGGISQRAKDGGANMSMDGRTDICSCNICTSTIRGGRMSQGAMDGGVTYGWAGRCLLLGNCSCIA